ncbi:amidohydrolase family protein [Polluticaenibacter yanchengensis]|uniref:Amidohydrolase family protein n=1 Tax=Polluticaenibacter yanchengensis TaxID=3014562 RepID=A0ABT4UIB2_9BACT|nr:amidohydrolase family protein [Chitinophagaceae bacterium LY-5]
MNLKKAGLLALAMYCVQCGQAQEKDKKKWDVSNPTTHFKEISFQTSEGTWMNLDVSPDGKEIVFDLLGDIYSLPITGGKAKLLRGGLPSENQPQYSPDGKKILFTSDAGGGDNIWVMDRDGSNAKQITKETFRLLNNATFTPDGQYIIARKHFTSGRSLGAGEMWLYHITGGGGIQLTTRKNDQQDVNEPAMSPDGRYLYYSEDMYPGGFFQYNKDPNNEIFVINRYDRTTGKTDRITGGGGGAFRPKISHNGKLLAFIKRVRTKTVLYLRSLETGEEWPVYDKLSKDQIEAWTVYGAYVRYAFTPDDKHIIIWTNGKINKIDLSKNNESVEIPFEADVKQRLNDVVRFQQNINQDQFNVNVIRQAVTSPDGRWVVFNALGQLWKKQLPDGAPVRVTTGTQFEFDPAFSPDGKSIAFVQWNDADKATVVTSNLNGGAIQKVTANPGIYRSPSFSADGQKIVFVRQGSNNTLGEGYTTKPGIYVVGAKGGEPEFVTAAGGDAAPFFSKDAKTVYYQFRNSLASVDLDGNNKQTLLKGKYSSQFAISPDELWVAFVDLHKVYIAALPQVGKTIDMESGSVSYPVKQVSRDAGINLHFSADNKKLHYTFGDQYYTIHLDERFEFIANKPDSLFKLPDHGISIGLKGTTDKPKGSILFKNARIATMGNEGVLENSDILIEGNIIKAVGKNLTAPNNAKIIDATGKTIIPGFIDAHAHGNHFGSGITPQNNWTYNVNLAFGVTTMHDPSATSEYVFAQSELVKAGKIVGPRVFSTGTILYGADGDFKAVVNNYEDALSALRRSKAWGAFSVKSYNQPRREQRQMIIEGARELGMEVVPEGGSFYTHNMSMIADGHTTIEHNIPIPILYKDVVEFWKQSGTGYTPTLIVSYGSVSGEYYWYQKTDVWKNERLLRFTPRNIIDERSRHRTMLPDEEYENGHFLVSASAKRLLEAGVPVNMGAHGQIQGIGAHWEIYMMTQGGMSPLQALQTATINSAKSLGLDKSIGSLEPGKLADLLILDKNPLEDIYNSQSIKYTMVNGRLFNAETMAQEGNYPMPEPKLWWQNNKSTFFGFHNYSIMDTETQQCGCGIH